MTQLPKIENLRRAIDRRLAFFGIVIAMQFALFQAVPKSKDMHDFYFAVLITLTLYIFNEQVARKTQILELVEYLRTIQATSERSLDHKESILEVADKLCALHQCDDLIQKTGYYALDNAIADVKVNPKSEISIKGRESAFLAYTKFWDQVALATKNLNGQYPNAYLTHTTDVEKWIGDQGTHIMGVQADYARHARVFRVFVNREKSERFLLQKYIEVMGKMQDQHILCVYVHKSQLNELPYDCLDTDFCLVDGGNYSAEWALSSRGRVDGFRLTNDGSAPSSGVTQEVL